MIFSRASPSEIESPVGRAAGVLDLAGRWRGDPHRAAEGTERDVPDGREGCLSSRLSPILGGGRHPADPPLPVHVHRPADGRPPLSEARGERVPGAGPARAGDESGVVYRGARGSQHHVELSRTERLVGNETVGVAPWYPGGPGRRERRLVPEPAEPGRGEHRRVDVRAEETALGPSGLPGRPYGHRFRTEVAPEVQGA